MITIKRSDYVAFSTEFQINLLKNQLYDREKERKRLGNRALAMILDSRSTVHQIFFEWVITTQYDAYDHTSDDENWYLYPINLEQFKQKQYPRYVFFIPKKGVILE